VLLLWQLLCLALILITQICFTFFMLKIALLYTSFRTQFPVLKTASE
jgi:hypothetical protein